MASGPGKKGQISRATSKTGQKTMIANMRANGATNKQIAQAVNRARQMNAKVTRV